jgi:sulfur-oxidizing protein SoxY
MSEPEDPAMRTGTSRIKGDLATMTHNMTLRFNRRQALLIGGGAIGAMALGESIVPAYAKNDTEELIKKFTGGKQATPGKVKLDLPEIAENGNTVPLTVSVESPMTAQSHVTDVLVVADGNPRGGVATFHFSPASGAAEANTRIRLAATQNITAVAKMNDGSFYMDSKQVKVTIGGCGG